LPSDPDTDSGLVLGFDTSAAQCAAAVVSGDRVLASRVESMERGQAERLLPMLEEVLAESRAGWADLAALAVCTGPGNFTGIRVGVAAARGLALGLGVPAMGVTAFEAHSHATPARQTFALLAQGRWYCQTAQAGERIGEPAEIGAGPLAEGRGDREAGDRGAPVRPGPVDPASVALWAAARLAAGRPGTVARPVPFYLREADAAPSAEPPPRILDDDA
jgi:tRNA threonylcarbamoyladenosine biosynthesis protein TsaB